MRVLAVVHQADAGLGVFAQPLAERGHQVAEWTPAESTRPPEGFDAAIVLGGGMHPDHEDEHPWLRAEKRWLAGLLGAGTPVLGVCLGAELLAEAAGTPARRMEAPDVGWHEVMLTADGREDPVVGGLPERFTAFEWHSFETPLPRDATALALGGGRVEAFRLGRAWGVQFHAEITREMLGDWVGSYREDPDLLAAGVDPTPLLDEAGARMGPSTAVGAELAGRFADHAAALTTRNA